MVIGDLNYVLLCPITNTRDKCLTTYDNYMVIGDLNYVVIKFVSDMGQAGGFSPVLWRPPPVKLSSMI
jgi:hypothetical protein